ncbi:MAG: glycosyltransferase family 4 protein [Chloroflexota bacterium]
MKPDNGILLIGNFLSHAGFPRGVCEDLSERLQKTGWDVITTSHKPGRLPRLFDILTTIWRKRDLFSVAHVDVFSGLAFFWAEASCWLLRRLNKPFSLTLHGGNLPLFACRWPGRIHRLLVSAAAVTTPSNYLVEAMRSYRQDIRLIPNPIDLAAYPFRLRFRPKPRLIWLRSFHSIYNPVLASRVLAALLPHFPNTTLTMIGPDKGDGSLQKTLEVACKLNVMEHIRFVGGVPKVDVPLWLNQGDIFINTTNMDNFPVSVIEAMACGLCIVSTDVGGIPCLLKDEHDALLVPPNNPLEMASDIRRILTEPGLAERLSLNARHKSEQFDWKVILPQWESLFRELISLA